LFTAQKYSLQECYAIYLCAQINSMLNILVIGAGRSTGSLIQYLIQKAENANWHIVVADQNLELAQSKVKQMSRGEAIALDVRDDISRVHAISKADIVVSMLPAHMHVQVAEDCIALRKHMVTASYISPEMEALDARAKEAGVILLNEIGVDPGVDHLSAMKVIDEIRKEGGEMTLFESFTGGLPAPGSDHNPWKYKFTWNPRNVVLAGAGGAVKFRQEDQYKYIPYHKVFRRTEIIEVGDYGRFEGYANRDSLKYRKVYGMEDISTIYRGTLRRPGFCRAWATLVSLGMTDDNYQIAHSADMTYRQFTNLFLAYHPTDSVELKFMHYLNIPQDSDLMEKIDWLGLLDSDPIGLENATPAQILQKRLEEKWKMNEGDKDMIVMHHKFGYRLKDELKMKVSSMVTLGEDELNTAMGKTVGLPVGIATRLIIEGIIHSPGVQLPITPEIYNPMLAELAEFGIVFDEQDIQYTT